MRTFINKVYNTLEMKAAAFHFEVKEENVRLTTMFKCKIKHSCALKRSIVFPSEERFKESAGDRLAKNHTVQK